MMRNSTLFSSPDVDGRRYKSRFDYRSFAKGDTFKAFAGRLSGKGPRNDESSVVKVFRKELGSDSLCDIEIMKSRKARELASRFEKLQLPSNRRIEFVSLLKAQMDEVSMFKIGSRKLSKWECVLIEEEVPTEKFKTYVSKKGESCSEVLSAFVHFTYHESGGQLVICGLEGGYDEDGFHLKCPMIYSIAKMYGECDRGKVGISEVMDNHVCNGFCVGMNRPEEFEGNRAPAVSMNTSSVSAPDLVPVQNNHEQEDLSFEECSTSL